MTFNLRTTLFSITFMIGITACNTKPAATNIADTTNTAKQLIGEHFKYLNSHDLKSLVTQYDDKAKITTTDWDGVSFGKQGADQIFHQLFYISPDAKYLVDNMLVADSVVVVEYDVVGLKENANSPVRHDTRNCSIFKIKNNKISSEATYSNLRLYHNQ